MLARIRRRRLRTLFLDIVFVVWVLYVTASGRLLPEQLSFRNHPSSPPSISQPVQAPDELPAVIDTHDQS